MWPHRVSVPVAGRSDDMFRVRGVNVFLSSLEGILRERGLDRFAIVLERFPVEPPVELLVEGATAGGELAEAVKARLGSRASSARRHCRAPKLRRSASTASTPARSGRDRRVPPARSRGGNHVSPTSPFEPVREPRVSLTHPPHAPSRRPAR